MCAPQPESPFTVQPPQESVRVVIDAFLLLPVVRPHRPTDQPTSSAAPSVSSLATHPPTHSRRTRSIPFFSLLPLAPIRSFFLVVPSLHTSYLTSTSTSSVPLRTAGVESVSYPLTTTTTTSWHHPHRFRRSASCFPSLSLFPSSSSSSH